MHLSWHFRVQKNEKQKIIGVPNVHYYFCNHKQSQC